jgi:hypothetical protein
VVSDGPEHHIDQPRAILRPRRFKLRSERRHDLLGPLEAHKVEWLDIVIVLDARETTSKIGMKCIGHAGRAQLFGLLEGGLRSAPWEQDFLTTFFGFHELAIPHHSHCDRVVLLGLKKVKSRAFG